MEKDSPIDPRATAIENIKNDTVTAEELRALRKSLVQTPATQLKELREEVKQFEQRNGALLLTDAEIGGELDELRAELDKKEATDTPATSTNTLPTEPAREPHRATTIIYEQWKKMMDPNESKAGRIARTLGFVAAGYGIYRLATWVTGRPKNTRTWKFLKYTGLAALAAWTIGVLTHKKDAAAAETENKPYDVADPAAPAPTSTTPEKDPNAPPSALDALPAGKELVGGPAYDIPVDGAVYKVQFLKDAIMINGKKFTLAAKGALPFGGDASLSIFNASVKNNKLSVTAGAFGKKGGTEWSEAELKGLLSELMGKGSSEQKTNDGTTVLIKSATK